MKAKLLLIIVMLALSLISYSQSSMLERNREILLGMQTEIRKVVNEIQESVVQIGSIDVGTTDIRDEIRVKAVADEYASVVNETSEAYLPDIYPISSVPIVSSKYGTRIDPFTGRKAFHSGIDLSVPENMEVFSCGSGKVIEAAYNRINGNYIIIDHKNKYQSYYGHLSRVFAKHGDKVIKGQIIGLSGNTGMSTGPHIHFQISFDGKTINPLTIIK
jgi:murein DD-endopeptidase MepM/ murein hydrolase activator NlpD